MLRYIIRRDYQCIALLDSGVTVGAVPRRVSELNPCDRSGGIAAVEQEHRCWMLQTDTGEFRRIRVLRHDPRSG